MKNSQKGFIVPILIAIIAILAIGGGVYIYESKKVEVPAVTQTQQDTTRTQTQTSVSTKPTTPTLKVEFSVVTVEKLTYSPSSFLNKKVQVTGKLILTGKNYFTDPRFAVADGTNKFQVSTWLVLEVPPPMPGSTGGPPSTMATYLDKAVTLQGVVEQNDQGFFLRVTKSI